MEDLLKKFNKIIQDCSRLILEYQSIHLEINRSENFLYLAKNKNTYINNFSRLSDHLKKYKDNLEIFNSLFEQNKNEMMTNNLEPYIFIKRFREYLNKMDNTISFHLSIQEKLAAISRNRMIIFKPKEFRKDYEMLNHLVVETDNLGRGIIEQMVKVE